MTILNADVAVLGAGPAGLAAGIAAHKAGADVVLIEREARPGGILKQCIHDGFGLLRYGEKLSGPEYVGRFVQEARAADLPIFTSTFVSGTRRAGKETILMLVNRAGVTELHAGAVVLATGCRERSARQIMIQGARPAGILTAGTAQYFVNILGYLPCTRCVILGSGDVGLIMARRLTLEGAEVLGVFEAKQTPSGLSRNIAQCLDDFHIPLHLSRTVTRIIGEDRVEAVEIAEVDERLQPIPGTEQLISCDGVILSVGLIPENEVAESLGVPLDPATKGPFMDQTGQTRVPGIFVCGNAGHVNDLVDYVSDSGERAGAAAAAFAADGHERRLLPVSVDHGLFLYAVPQEIDMEVPDRSATLYFRSRDVCGPVTVELMAGDVVLLRRRYLHLRPPEMQRLQIDLRKIPHDVASLVLTGTVASVAEGVTP